AREELASLSPTERDAVTKSRLGQGPFREKLQEYWRGCSLTGCDLAGVLRASHIKPWRLSSNRERLDLYNGLLLTANYDALFDRGLISFRDDGSILVSDSLPLNDRRLLGVSSELRLRRVE